MVNSLIYNYNEGIISATPPLDLARRDEIGRTPLHLCGLDAQVKSKPEIDIDCARIVSMLKEVGFDVNARCKAGWSPLDTYATLGLPETVNVLLNSGAEIDGTDPEHGRTALMRSTINGNFVVSKLLIEKGAEVNMVAEGGKVSALSYAVRNEVMRKVATSGEGVEEEGGGEVFNLLEMLEQEIEGGEVGDKQCSSNREKNDKNSVFDLGCEPGKEYLRITELLVSSGADVNLQDKNGRTPIMIAALAGHKNLVQMLLKTGKVKLSIVDNDGFGSITYAKTQEIREMIVVYL